jgi:hypothetical protein
MHDKREKDDDQNYDHQPEEEHNDSGNCVPGYGSRSSHGLQLPGTARFILRRQATTSSRRRSPGGRGRSLKPSLKDITALPFAVKTTNKSRAPLWCDPVRKHAVRGVWVDRARLQCLPPRRPRDACHPAMPLGLPQSRFMIAGSLGVYAAETARDHAVSLAAAGNVPSAGMRWPSPIPGWRSPVPRTRPGSDETGTSSWPTAATPRPGHPAPGDGPPAPGDGATRSHVTRVTGTSPARGSSSLA